MTKVLMKGAEVFGEAAIKAGCRYFFGYPITPQNEIPEYMSAKLPHCGGVYVQGESEVASINMVLGAAASGAQVMTSSSSPGISLMSEGMSYLAGSELPCVVVNVMRAGPGLGGILPAQGDYNQATKGGGHGDYHAMVFAPSSLQEVVELVQGSWDFAFKYRTPVIILADGFMGQMMEPVEINERECNRGDYKSWALGYFPDRQGKRTLLKSLYLAAEPLETHNKNLQAKYAAMQEDARWENYHADDAELVITAFGTVARIAKTAVDHLRAEGKKVGLIRPITLFPFPLKAFENLPKAKKLFDVEMNYGQMLVDVKNATENRWPISFYGRAGGFAPSVEEIETECRKLLG
ncbi:MULTISPECIES: 3-methyl-2-oxobutanoate dehydrogenase subunit VorB [Jonquetella]|uniref:2-oxoacid:ferredoxin oxidoreductase, alpha subunit n=1 Tax=Jonquetella anthropi DSM 22815 TaxID=885272 RepID=H0UM05_9BACT|nr:MULTISPECIES: 3-methyl-2-oxobutanoate dehydrogenase subunit VorB [Jonquetella]EEX47566.1 pyruvate flavodoxin/ferredoxin oxidoreductase, thiamine diP-binding domain protein [Jonquetella anthropi E3_33 E1]EHM12547.1 2-oxoacid:ferredoxin oxidoreductase, alpha subunit [Jonquetella anthropi DSM 22815]ERL24696.1 pyruvate flavodoxin/ferredoxin oxidoreductase, thiamine diP-binding domain protein [Jonquetella sp. BV3C21]